MTFQECLDARFFPVNISLPEYSPPPVQEPFLKQNGSKERAHIRAQEQGKSKPS
jgi:hypothetical protein